MELYREVAQAEYPGDWWESRFFQALAWRNLGYREKTDEISRYIVSHATQRLERGSGTIDFFAKFGEQKARQTQRAEAHYLLGLGLFLQEKTEEAVNQFEQACNYNKGHVWARYYLSRLR